MLIPYVLLIAVASSAFAQFALPKHFTGSALVWRRETTLFESTQGAAVAANSRFRIGSLTKQFTAAAILRLQDQGKLSVRDPLSRHLPSFPRAAGITLHHLLTHSSGLADLNRSDFEELRHRPQAYEQALDRIGRRRARRLNEALTRAED